MFKFFKSYNCQARWWLWFIFGLIDRGPKFDWAVPCHTHDLNFKSTDFTLHPPFNSSRRAMLSDDSSCCNVTWYPKPVSIPDKKRSAYSSFFIFYFSELDKIFQLFHLNSSIVQLSTTLGPKIHLIRSESESMIMLEMGDVSKSCHKCFNMKYCHHPRADALYTVDAPDKKEKGLQ